MQAGENSEHEKKEKLPEGPPRQLSLTEAQHLKKEEYVAELEKRGLVVERTVTRDVLRERLVAIVRSELAEEDNKQTQATTTGSSSGVRRSGEEDQINREEDRCSDDGMATSTHIFFRRETDDWESFTDRLEMYFIVKNITEADMKRAILLTHIDEETYKLFKDLCAPDKPSGKPYSELIKILTEHLNPAPSEVMERYIFHRARQEQNETISEFVTRLRRLALNCNFAGQLNEALRDQLVCGIHDESIRIELFKQPKLTLEIAIKEAVGRESAIKNAAEVHKTLPQRNFKLESFAMSPTQPHKPEQYKQSGNQQRKKYQQPQTNTQRREGTTCYCCGQKGHGTYSCRYRDHSCNFCKIKGHLERACIKKKKMDNKYLQEDSSRTDHDDEDASGSSTAENTVDFHAIDGIYNVHNCNTISAEPMFMDVGINGRTVTMEVDSGTYFSVMSEGFIERNFKELARTKSGINLRSYEDNVMEPRGQLRNLKVTLNGRTENLHCLVLKGNKVPLIGRQWLAAFGLWPLVIPTNLDETGKRKTDIHKLHANDVPGKLLTEFATLFSDTPGVYNKREVKIHVKPNTQPVAFGARHVPYALRPKIEQEIERLVKLGHLERVESSEWATPIVPVLKSDGKIRICGDFKRTLNPHLKITKRSFPRIDDIFAVMRNGLTFSQLDLPHAYMQIGVDKESRELLTIATHTGLLRYTKMVEGTAIAPSEFTKIMEECLQGIPNTIAYMDNIFVTGKTDEEHFENLRRVCERLTDRGMRLNKGKCEFMKDRIEILGFVIDKTGLHKSKSKVKAMYEAPRPQNNKQLTSFLGLINFYSRFLENRSDKLKPLFDCANNVDFKWTKECEEAFCWVKKEMISPRVLAHYDPNEQLILACDASHYGLSAILSHRYKNGAERPIAFASKRIPEKELNRAIIDKEASAIVFGLMKFYDFVYGRKIILRTDHKPLEAILGPKRGIPLTAASRLQRWAQFVSSFEYDIEWVKSNQNGNCDALSRLPIEDDTNLFDVNSTQMHYVLNDANVIDYVTIQHETKRDPTLARVTKFCIFGWPTDRKNLSEEENKFFPKRHELAIEADCIFWGYRIVVPEKLQTRILEDLHLSHMGVVKMKALARSYVWWPGIDADIESIASSCKTCIENRKTPPHTIPTPWPWPEKAWHRIHCDFLGPYYNDMYLVVVDSFSKWPEVFNFKQDTRARKLIKTFEELFARHGLPDHVVSDNGPQFASVEFGSFLKKNKVNHSFSPPYHPATNGAAENFVGTFKDKIAKIVQGGKSVDTAINQFLFDYRSIPHCTTGKSPARLLYGREIKTRFDLLRPNLREKTDKRQEAQIASRPKPRKVELSEGDTVMIDNWGKSGGKRIEGKIVRQLSPSTFRVETESGTMAKRHIRQIVKPVRRSERIASKAANNQM